MLSLMGTATIRTLMVAVPIYGVSYEKGSFVTIDKCHFWRYICSRDVNRCLKIFRR
jgi:hypothetical protein